MNENKIDRYLLNLLSPEDRQAFEAQLKNDENLVQEVDEQREILKDIEGIGRIELKSKLKDIHKELDLDSQKSNTKFRNLFFRFAIAAIFLGVLSFGWWSLQQTPSNTELYSQNFEPFELSLNQRSEGNIALNKIENLYLDGNYEQAIPLFQDVLNNNVQSSQLLLGLGIAYLETEQPEKAISQFARIISSQDFNYEDEAQWYISLAYLKIEDFDKAINHLTVLTSDATKDHHKAANELLSQLKKN